MRIRFTETVHAAELPNLHPMKQPIGVVSVLFRAKRFDPPPKLAIMLEHMILSPTVSSKLIVSILK